MIDRRRFIGAALAASPYLVKPRADAKQSTPMAMTVGGPVRADRLGATLMHEHVMVDFVGADRVSPDRYRAAEVFGVALPHLRDVRAAGCRTLVDCTPAYLGRDVQLLRKLSTAAELHIVTTTGYYGAAGDKFVPNHAYKLSAEELAALWTREFEQGIDGTDIKPGIIKIGVDAGPLSAIDRKLIEAAALTHLRTGLTVGAHTGDGVAAFEQLRVLERMKVSPSAFVWMHAQNERDRSLHVDAARRGCWVEFDGIGEKSRRLHLDLVANLHKHQLLDRTLISMDAGWYHVGEPGGGNYRGYREIFSDFLPTLKNELGEAAMKLLTTINPHRALTLRPRPSR